MKVQTSKLYLESCVISHIVHTHTLTYLRLHVYTCRLTSPWSLSPAHAQARDAHGELRDILRGRLEVVNSCLGTGRIASNDAAQHSNKAGAPRTLASHHPPPAMWSDAGARLEVV